MLCSFQSTGKCAWKVDAFRQDRVHFVEVAGMPTEDPGDRYRLDLLRLFSGGPWSVGSWPRIALSNPAM